MDKDTISSRIIQLRKSYRFTQSQLANKMGISEDIVLKWENSEEKPNIDEMISLSKIFNVSMDYLINGIIRSGDEKSIKREPTYEELCEDCKDILKAFLKKHEISKYFDQLYNDLIKSKYATLFVYDSIREYYPYHAYFDVEKIIKFNDYKLFDALYKKGWLEYNGDYRKMEHRIIHSLLSKFNITDLDFYLKIDFSDYELDNMISSYVYGNREWNDKVILTLIKQGGCVTDSKTVGAGENSYPVIQRNIFFTRLLKDYCERRIKK